MSSETYRHGRRDSNLSHQHRPESRNRDNRRENTHSHLTHHRSSSASDPSSHRHDYGRDVTRPSSPPTMSDPATCCQPPTSSRMNLNNLLHSTDAVGSSTGSLRSMEETQHHFRRSPPRDLRPSLSSRGATNSTPTSPRMSPQLVRRRTAPSSHSSAPQEVVYTDEARFKTNDYVRRVCHLCGEKKTSAWRRSVGAPGKMLCNRCGLAERQEIRMRPASHLPLNQHGIVYTDDEATPLSDSVRRRCYTCSDTDSATPQWRRSIVVPGKIVCNRCGLFESRNERWMDISADGTIYTMSDEYTKASDRVRRRCFNCSETQSSSWRRSSLSTGKILCNRCGLYERQYMQPRPQPEALTRGSPMNESSSPPPERARSPSPLRRAPSPLPRRMRSPSPPPRVRSPLPPRAKTPAPPRASCYDMPVCPPPPWYLEESNTSRGGGTERRSVPRSTGSMYAPYRGDMSRAYDYSREGREWPASSEHGSDLSRSLLFSP